MKNSKSILVFDLDDTLYKEIDFVKSGFSAICNFLNINDIQSVTNFMLLILQSKKDAIAWLMAEYEILKNKEELIEIYRNHKPSIGLDEATKNLLKYLKDSFQIFGLITDGRSITQRNKISALGLDEYFDKIIISEEIGSEKPALQNFAPFFEYSSFDITYIGDNTQKDFLTPNRLGWNTICLLDNGQNIHKQNFNLSTEYLPKHKIEKIEDLINYL